MGAMTKLWGLRWWMMGLLMAGVDHQLPHAQHAVGRGADLLTDLHITTQQYSWILERLPGRDHAAAALRLRARHVGLKLGFAIFAVAWSFISMAHGLAGSWQALAGLRALLGFAEGSANPAGMKATSEWFPAARARPGRRLVQHRRVARLDAGAAARRVGDPDVQLAVRVRDHRRVGLGWVALWLLFYQSPSKHPALSEDERDYILVGPGTASRRDAGRPSIREILRQRNFWGIALPRFLADPTWGTLTFWLPLYLTTVRDFDLKQIALFAWLPFLAADLGCLFGGTISLALQKYAGVAPDQCAARRVHGRRAADDRRGVRRVRSRARMSPSRS